MYHCIIIGAGPSGLMAGVACKNTNSLILEKNNIAGKKLLLTGGGRCNLTNLKSNNDFLNNIDYNKKYLYSAINMFGPKEIYDYFENNGVLLKEEDNNRIFPRSNKSADILSVLLKNTCNIKYNEEVIDIKVFDEYKEVITNNNKYKTKNIIISTGGSSYKNTGSTGDNIKFASIINQPTINLFPTEVGVILKEKLLLAGTSIENVVVKYNKYKKEGNLIFTHRGLSGISIMSLSEYIYLNEDKTIHIDLLPSYDKEELINYIKNYDLEKEIITCLNNFFSKKLITYLLDKLNIKSLKIKNLKNTDLIRLVDLIKNLTYIVDKVCSIDEAYATGGGIDLKYINTTNMESTINKGIYFVGEALDIHGPIGGYNITLALSTGYQAGSNIYSKLNVD